MRHTAFDALPPKVAAALAAIIILSAIVYALIKGKVFLLSQPDRSRSPALFYFAVSFLVVMLVISIVQFLRN